MATTTSGSSAVAPTAEPGPRGTGLGPLIRGSLQQPLTSYWLVVGAAGLLVLFGVLMVLSASSVFAQQQYGDSFYFVKKQALFLAIGAIGAAVLSRLSLARLQQLGWAGLILAFGLLVATYTPLGHEVKGNRNWLELGPIGIQPSEFAKLAIIVWGASVLATKERVLDSMRHLFVPYLPVVGLLTLLVVFQGDLGTAIIMGLIIAAVLFAVGTPMIFLVGATALASVGTVAALVTSDNRLNRLRHFLSPDAGADGGNLQAQSALEAMASGGWWGVGIGASRQKWGALPEAHTDFIFAVIGEETGLFGTLAVLALFLVLGYAGLRIAMRSDQLFCRLMATGVTAWFLLQAIINLAVVMRMVPVMGVPLPLLSYGGSALLANLLAVGVLLACARHEPQAREVLARAARRGRAPRVTTLVGRSTR